MKLHSVIGGDIFDYIREHIPGKELAEIAVFTTKKRHIVQGFMSLHNMPLFFFKAIPSAYFPPLRTAFVIFSGENIRQCGIQSVIKR